MPGVAPQTSSDEETKQKVHNRRNKKRRKLKTKKERQQEVACLEHYQTKLLHACIERINTDAIENV